LKAYDMKIDFFSVINCSLQHQNFCTGPGSNPLRLHCVWIKIFQIIHKRLCVFTKHLHASSKALCQKKSDF